VSLTVLRMVRAMIPKEPTKEELAQASSMDLAGLYYKEARDFLYARLDEAKRDGNLSTAEALDVFKTYRAHCEQVLAAVTQFLPLQSQQAGVALSLLTLTLCAYNAGSCDAERIKNLKQTVKGGPAAYAAAARNARAELSGSREIDEIIDMIARQVRSDKPSLSEAALARAVREQVNARIPDLLKKGKTNAKTMSENAIRKRLRKIFPPKKVKTLVNC